MKNMHLQTHLKKWAWLTSIYNYQLFTNKITIRDSGFQFTGINLKLVYTKKLQKIHKQLFAYFLEKNI